MIAISDRATALLAFSYLAGREGSTRFERRMSARVESRL